MSKTFIRFLVAYIIKVHEYAGELEDRVKELEKDHLKMGEDINELQRFQSHLTQLLEDKND